MNTGKVICAVLVATGILTGCATKSQVPKSSLQTSEDRTISPSETVHDMSSSEVVIPVSTGEAVKTQLATSPVVELETEAQPKEPASTEPSPSYSPMPIQTAATQVQSSEHSEPSTEHTPTAPQSEPETEAQSAPSMETVTEAIPAAPAAVPTEPQTEPPTEAPTEAPTEPSAESPKEYNLSSLIAYANSYAQSTYSFIPDSSLTLNNASYYPGFYGVVSNEEELYAAAVAQIQYAFACFQALGYDLEGLHCNFHASYDAASGMYYLTFLYG